MFKVNYKTPEQRQGLVDVKEVFVVLLLTLNR